MHILGIEQSLWVFFSQPPLKARMRKPNHAINKQWYGQSNSNSILFSGYPFVYTKDLLTSVKWKAEDGEISVEVDIFPNAAKSGWTKGLLTWAKFILRQMSSTAKYRFKSMSIQPPSFLLLFFSWAPVCSALPSGFVYIVGRRVGAWKWKMKGERRKSRRTEAGHGALPPWMGARAHG